MLRTFTVTESPSISVIQGAYEWLRAADVQGSETHLDGGTYHTDSIGKLPYLVFPVPQLTLPNLAEEWLRFQFLRDQWYAERGAMSSITEMSNCPSYQHIIGMGPTVIPFILAQIEAEGEEPDQWFWALRAIAGENPVPDEAQGDYFKMSRCWLDWGRRRGYAW